MRVEDFFELIKVDQHWGADRGTDLGPNLSQTTTGPQLLKAFPYIVRGDCPARVFRINEGPSEPLERQTSRPEGSCSPAFGSQRGYKPGRNQRCLTDPRRAHNDYQRLAFYELA